MHPLPFVYQSYAYIRSFSDNIQVPIAFAHLAELMGINRTAFASMLEQVKEALQQWTDFATQSGVGPGLSNIVKTSIQQALRLV